MAKLFNVDETDDKKADIKKIIALSLSSLILIIVSIFVYSSVHTDEDPLQEADICVHVKGAVDQSGVYYVPFGTRVCDLEDYVGGFSENADIDGVNMAAFVNDGQEVYIPYKGSAETGAVNLNTATSDELQLVSGIGENYARKILKYRESHGKFTSVTELREILGVSLYEAVRESFYVQ